MDNLKHLLIQYFKELPEERQQWQPRVMEVSGVEQKELTYLHGMLIAQGCYRITSLGTREVRGFQDSLEEA
ncbi:hypothetical protein EBS67_07650 [bacterium]|nr:hypothetical protein [bacterium]